MNWISNYVRPKINSLFSRREVPENLWTKCPECGTMLFHRELTEGLGVCSNCDHHMPLSARDRMTALERLRETLGYVETLKRGYAVVRGDGAVVTGKAAAEQAQELEHLFSIKPKDATNKINTVKELFQETGAVSRTLTEIETYTDKAFKTLEMLRVEPGKKEILRQFGTALMKREV